MAHHTRKNGHNSVSLGGAAKERHSAEVFNQVQRLVEEMANSLDQDLISQIRRRLLEYLSSLLHDLQSSRDIAQKNLKYILSFLHSDLSKRKSPKTLSKYLFHLKEIWSFLCTTGVDIQRDDDSFLFKFIHYEKKRKARKKKETSINQALAMFKRLIRFVDNQNPSVPIRDLDDPAKKLKTNKGFASFKVLKYLNKLMGLLDPKGKLIARLGLIGLREQGIYSLRVSKLERSLYSFLPHITVYEKKKWRHVYLSDFPDVIRMLREFLKERKKQGNTKSDYLFLKSNGRPYSNPRSLVSMVTRRFKDIGIKGENFHFLRHVTGNLLILRGWSLRQVADFLGHSLTATTVSNYLSCSTYLATKELPETHGKLLDDLIGFHQEWIGTKEASNILSLSRRQIENLAKKIPYLHIKNKLLLRKEDIFYYKLAKKMRRKKDI